MMNDVILIQLLRQLGRNFSPLCTTSVCQRQPLQGIITVALICCFPNGFEKAESVCGTFQVGARLISHAGSLTNLAKYPASTVQILGAEKALFRYSSNTSNTRL